MLFAEYRDFDPFDTYKGYILSKAIHDDGDCIKWDWEIYRFVKNKTYDGSDHVYRMHEFVCCLEISPYERNENLILDMFRNMAGIMFSEEYWSEGPIFS